VNGQQIYLTPMPSFDFLTDGTGGGTDAGYAGRSGKPAVLESLGLAGWGYHAKNEYVEIDSIVPRLYLSARLLNDLARE